MFRHGRGRGVLKQPSHLSSHDVPRETRKELQIRSIAVRAFPELSRYTHYIFFYLFFLSRFIQELIRRVASEKHAVPNHARKKSRTRLTVIGACPESSKYIHYIIFAIYTRTNMQSSQQEAFLQEIRLLLHVRGMVMDPGEREQRRHNRFIRAMEAIRTIVGIAADVVKIVVLEGVFPGN